MTVASASEDYAQTEKFARDYLQECTWWGGADRGRGIVLAFFIGGMAEYQSGRYQDALETADNCLKHFYSVAPCHYVRAYALAYLKRRSESKEELIRTRQAAMARLQLLQSLYGNATDAATREKWQEESEMQQGLKRKAEEALATFSSLGK